MNTTFKTALVCLLLVSQTYERCGFSSEKQKQTEVHDIDAYGENGRFLQTTNWTPINIYLDYTTLDSQKGKITDELIANIKTLMTNVAAAYTNLINVKSASYAIKMSSCGTDVIISTAVKTGVQADIVIFPFVDFTYEDTTEAAATYCARDKTTGRPLAGYVGFNKNMSFSGSNAMYYNELLVFHEINHVLSFNPALFDQYIDANGAQRGLSSVVTSATVNGVTRQMISTPKVLEKARAYFNCQSMTGVELENQGGDGTAGAHWEERIMEGDYMIGQSYAENVISEITLALMEDSGWYKPNYYTGGLFKFGKNQGCDFLNTKCIVNGGTTKFPNEYATTIGTSMCFTGRTAKGVSSLLSSANPPADYQYFTDFKKGADRINADYCPTATEIGKDGWWFPSSCWMGYSDRPTALGEQIGTNSLCFISSLTPSNDPTWTNYKGLDRAICHAVTCSSADRTYKVTIGTTSVLCPTAGGPATATGFDGVLMCADYNLICTKNGTCGDAMDCINKKVTPLTSTYDYVAMQSTSSAGTVTPTTSTVTPTPATSTVTPTPATSTVTPATSTVTPTPATSTVTPTTSTVTPIAIPTPTPSTSTVTPTTSTSTVTPTTSSSTVTPTTSSSFLSMSMVLIFSMILFLF